MIAPLIRLMRPGDWVKNVFVLPAIVFWAAGSWGEPMGTKVVATACAFVAFCLISSGFYAINDVLDAAGDRRHPVKRRRPVASGEVPATVALVFGAGLIAAALVVAATVNSLLVANLVAYALVQLLYNVGIKRVMLVDVVAIATGFALRATAGAVAIGVQISAWLVLCVFFLCLYLGFIKRLCDLASARADASGGEWKSPAGYDDRAEIDWLLVVSAVIAIVTYLMYAFSGHARILFGPRAVGFAMLSPLVMIAIHRFYRRASRGESDSPLAALREDRVVLSTVLLFSAGVVMTLYVPFVGHVLEQLFIAGALAVECHSDGTTETRRHREELELGILFATSNPHKVDEVRAVLGAIGVEVEGLDALKVVPEEPEEDGETFAANARLKAIYYARATGRRCLADDSGLAVDALGGAPGVYSARYAGVGATRAERDRANNDRLLRELAGIAPGDRTARFVCAMCVADPDGTVVAEAEGTFEGFITDVPAGANGFGYDPLLYLPDEGCTSAQLTPEEKNARSHRGQAARAILRMLAGS